MFSGNVRELTLQELEIGFKDVPSYNLTNCGGIVDILVESGIASSKREAREFVGNGSIRVNGEKITDVEFEITKNIAIEGQVIVIRKGKKSYTLLKFD